MNVDGSFSVDDGASYGVVIRNEKGDVLLSAWGLIRHASNAEEVELLACKEGVLLASRWSKPTILESDCLTAIKLLQRPENQRSQAAFIIKEAIQAASSLPVIVFKHAKREQNVVAHELAQLARRLSHSAVWYDRVPVCVEHVIARDCVNIHE